jgi:hypothetical protein
MSYIGRLKPRTWEVQGSAQQQEGALTGDMSLVPAWRRIQRLDEDASKVRVRLLGSLDEADRILEELRQIQVDVNTTYDELQVRLTSIEAELQQIRDDMSGMLFDDRYLRLIGGSISGSLNVAQNFTVGLATTLGGFLEAQMGASVAASLWVGQNITSEAAIAAHGAITAGADVVVGADLVVPQPLPCTNMILVVNSGRIEISFSPSGSARVDEYEIAVARGAGPYKIVRTYAAEDVSPGTTLLYDCPAPDTYYVRATAMYKKRRSNGLTQTAVVTQAVLDPTIAFVVPYMDKILVHYQIPDDPRIEKVEVYVDAKDTAGALTPPASPYYTGRQDRLEYPILPADRSKLHQFWIKSIARS